MRNYSFMSALAALAMTLVGCGGGAASGPAGPIQYPAAAPQSKYALATLAVQPQPLNARARELLSKMPLLVKATPAPPIGPIEAKSLAAAALRSGIPDVKIRPPKPLLFSPTSGLGISESVSPNSVSNDYHNVRATRIPTNRFGNAEAIYSNMTAWTIEILQPDQTIYAPTMSGLNIIPYEVTIGYTSGQPFIGTFDFGPSGGNYFHGVKYLAASGFQSSYVRNFGDGLPELTTEITWDGTVGNYTSYLYNYSNSHWEAMYNGHPALPQQTQEGHDFFEYYMNVGDVCPRVPTLSATGIMVYDAAISQWAAATPYDSYDYRDPADACFTGAFDWIETMIQPNNRWTMNGGN